MLTGRLQAFIGLYRFYVGVPFFSTRLVQVCISLNIAVKHAFIGYTDVHIGPYMFSMLYLCTSYVESLHLFYAPLKNALLDIYYVAIIVHIVWIGQPENHLQKTDRRTCHQPSTGAS